jgi:uncharacterized protein YlxW (UPF0749 family)
MSGLLPVAVTDREDSMRLLYLVLDDANHTFGPPIPKGNQPRFRTVFMGFSIFVVIGILFGTAIGLTRTLEPIQDTTRQQLQERISSVQLNLTEAQLALEMKNLELADLRNYESSQSLKIRELNDAITQLAAISSYQSLRGDGVKITIQASVKPSVENGVDLGIVLDSDISRIVNGVFANGAIGVAINGYRITSKSAIRSAGQAILVGYQPLSPPYEIVAIGNPTRILAELRNGKTGEDIKEISKNYGVRFDSVQVNQVTIPESTAPLRSRVSVRIIQ